MTDEKTKPEYPCQYCEKVCKQPQALKMHIKHKHPNEFTKLYPNSKPAESKPAPKPKVEEKDEGEKESGKGSPFLAWLFPASAIDNE